MSVIRHAMNGQHFGFSVLNKSCHVFMQFFFVFPGNKALAPSYCKNELQIDLRKCIGHCNWLRRLLRSPGTECRRFYKQGAPPDRGFFPEISGIFLFLF